jgi:peroxiredoxin
MVSRGDQEAHRQKAAEHKLTFPIVLQKQWEISRAYAMFATPIAYLIDEAGMIAADVAVGVEPIRALLARAAPPTNGKQALSRHDPEAVARRR